MALCHSMSPHASQMSGSEVFMKRTRRHLSRGYGFGTAESQRFDPGVQALTSRACLLS